MRRVFILGLFINLIISSNNFAQFNDYLIKGGLQYSQLLPITEFQDGKPYKASYLVRAYFRTELSHALDLEIGGGYGTLSGFDFDSKYYKSEFLPFDLRLVVDPFNKESINPYFYAGGGIMNYWIRNYPVSVSPGEVKEKGWTGFIPAGLGMEVKLSSLLVLDLSLGINYTFTDNLNYYTYNDEGSSPKDAYYKFSVGFTFYGGKSLTDSDGDGLDDEYELNIGLNPNDPDSDGDGLADGAEELTYNTSPFSRDSDHDGLSDFEEIMVYHSLPNKGDSDSDGILDGSEALEYKTDPMNADTDNDKLNDRMEIFEYGTDPLKTDTDGDGLTDSEELKTYSTDPLKVDTDEGMADDLTEIENRTNPRDPSDDIIIVGVPLVLKGLTFSPGTQDLTTGSQETLKRILMLLNSYPDYKFEIRGYTDNIGDADFNYKLTQKQADKVRAWLISRGVNPNQVTAVGYGSENPIASNETLAGRLQNRRIELVRIK